MKLFRTDYKLTPSFDLLNPSINLVRQHIWPVFYLMFLPSLIIVVGSVLLGSGPSGLDNQAETVEFGGRFVAGVTAMVIGSVWSVLTFPGSLIMMLQAVRGETPDTMDCFKRGLRRLLPMVGAFILLEFAVVGGFLLFIIPGLFLLRSFYLTQYYVVDQNLGPVNALKQSRADSKPNAGYIWGTLGVVLLLGLLGTLTGVFPIVGYILSLGVGLLYAFGPAMRYNEIKNLKLPRVV